MKVQMKKLQAFKKIVDRIEYTRNNENIKITFI